MRGEAREILIGLLVVATLALFVGSRYAQGPAEPTGDIRLRADFNYVGALGVGDEVRMGGIPIGRVTEIALNPESYRAETVLVVRPDAIIPLDSAAKVVSDGLIGGAHIDIDIGGEIDTLGNGDVFEITQDAVNLIELVGRIVFAEGEDEAAAEPEATGGNTPLESPGGALELPGLGD